MKTEVVVASVLSGRSRKEYAKEAEAVAAGDQAAGTPIPGNGASGEPLEAVVAM